VVEPKRMLEADRVGDQIVIAINYSSLELIQTCLRKAHYSLNRSLQMPTPSLPLAFGTAIHKALEIWYEAFLSTRTAMTTECHDAQQTYSTHDKCTRCAAISKFVAVYQEMVPDPPNASEARSVENAVDILNAYFSYYLTNPDPYRVFEDHEGYFIERHFEFPIYEDKFLKILYHGTIDMVVQHTETKALYLVDHKTTYSLGKDFMNRHRPNFQLSGYCLGAKECFGIETEYAIINGIQVAKYKRDFRRINTRRNETDFNELKIAVVHNVRKWIEACASRSFPMNTPNPCTFYGGCMYRSVCEVDEVIRENVIRSFYETDGDSK